jgi:peptidoglycan hydrolase CwlO-like protein
MGRIALILFLSLSCSFIKRESSNPIPPDVKPAIEALKKDSGASRETKEQVTKTLNSCQQYAEESNKRFEKLEADIMGLKAEIRSKDQKIAELEEELSTWRRIKFWSFAVLIGFAVFSFLRLLWANKAILMRLAGIPIP